MEVFHPIVVKTVHQALTAVKIIPSHHTAVKTTLHHLIVVKMVQWAQIVHPKDVFCWLLIFFFLNLDFILNVKTF